MNWVDLLWLLLFAVGLVALWLAIKGVEWLAQYVKEKKRFLDEEADAIAEETEIEEQKLLRNQRNREIIEHTDFSGDDANEVKRAISGMDANELGDVLMERMFGNGERNSDSIVAAKSAFVKEPETVVVAKASGIMPVVPKRKPKGTLSKAEQRIYDKIKRGE